MDNLDLPMRKIFFKNENEFICQTKEKIVECQIEFENENKNEFRIK